MGLIVKVSLLASLGSVLGPSSAPDQTTETPPRNVQELAARIRSVVDQQQAVGVAVALVGADGVFWTQGFGAADRERAIPATPDTLFRAGSISKSLTSLITMRLVEAGKLDLQARLKDIAPEVQFTNRWSETHPVRLVHLLEHTTGWDDLHFGEYRSVPEGTTIADGLNQNPLSRTCRWPPGTYTSYANSGPAVMGYVLEKVTRMRFEELARRALFQPLGLKTATFTQRSSDFERIARSYNFGGEPLPHSRLWATPSGAVAISARELGRIVQLHITGGMLERQRYLAPKSIDRIERPTSSLAAQAGLKRGYGLGNMAFDIGGIEYRGHGGGIDGFVSLFGYLRPGSGFVVLANGSRGVQEIVGLVSAFLKARGSAPTPPSAPVEADLTAYEGTYRLFTPRLELFRFLSDLAPAFVEAKEGKIRVSGSFAPAGLVYVPVGGGLFAREGRTHPSLIFFEGPRGTRELHGDFGANYRRITWWDFARQAVVFSGLGMAFGLTILSAIVWGFGRIIGRFENSRRWTVWAAPTLATAIVVPLLAIFGQLDIASMVQHLGGPSPLSRAIQGATVAFPILAAFGVVQCLRVRNVSPWVRCPPLLVSANFLAVAAFMFAYGWVGVTFWAYVPQVVGP